MNDMTCKEVVDVLSDYVEGELPPALRAELDRHFKACPPCLRYLDSFRKTIALGKSLSKSDCDKIPDELVNTILKARVLDTAPDPKPTA